MRVRITIDDDLFHLLGQEAKKQSLPVGQVLDRVLRAGLRREPYRVRTFSSGLLPGIDPAKLNQLVDELEIEAAIEKLRRFAQGGRHVRP